MTILGVDPSAGVNLGWSVLTDGELVEHGVYKPHDEDRGSRLKEIHGFVTGKLSEVCPDIVAFEDTTGGGWLPTRCRISEVGGVVRLAAAQFGIECRSVSGAWACKQLTGNGKQNKSRIKRAVRDRFFPGMRFVDIPLADHDADSIMIALAISSN